MRQRNVREQSGARSASNSDKPQNRQRYFGFSTPGMVIREPSLQDERQGPPSGNSVQPRVPSPRWERGRHRSVVERERRPHAPQRAAALSVKADLEAHARGDEPGYLLEEPDGVTQPRSRGVKASGCPLASSVMESDHTIDPLCRQARRSRRNRSSLAGELHGHRAGQHAAVLGATAISRAGRETARGSLVPGRRGRESPIVGSAGSSQLPAHRAVGTRFSTIQNGIALEPKRSSGSLMMSRARRTPPSGGRLYRIRPTELAAAGTSMKRSQTGLTVAGPNGRIQASRDVACPFARL